MLIEGNTWQSVWKTARPVPAHRQKRLFDDTKEAEKVLNFLEVITVGKICQLTIPVLFHNALLKIKVCANPTMSRLFMFKSTRSFCFYSIRRRQKNIKNVFQTMRRATIAPYLTVANYHARIGQLVRQCLVVRP
jgi:hypothetical protein